MTAALVPVPASTARHRGIDAAISRSRELGRPSLLTRVMEIAEPPDPLAFLAGAASALGGASLWWQPNAGFALAGAGATLTISADGPDRFETVSAAARALHETVVHDEVRARFPIIGGFAFSGDEEHGANWLDFPGAKLVVPTIVLQIGGGAALIRVNLRVEPTADTRAVEAQFDAHFQRAHAWSQSPFAAAVLPSGVVAESIPPRETWESTVATAVSLIRQGMLDKVVLAREERLRAAHGFSPLDTLAHLHAANGQTTLFALQAGTSWFLGATPERLVRLEAGRVDVTCLAGSIGAGRDPAEREHLASQLLGSAKDREEHEIVVRSAMSALEEVCEDVRRAPGTPRVVTARAVQHLETPLEAIMAEAGHVLDLVERLHPTPAVGGFPRNTAATVIRELEAISRGWYAGPFGWTDLDGAGEFAVAIRSALLSGRTASVFAGCGIVADSDPAAEFEEAGLKMQPMLAALGAA
jgi:isochorismate synthase